MNPIIKIENLSLSYNQGDATELAVLKNINLEIYENEYVIFFGPSGSGKSTLLYIIAGIETPTEGKVIFHDSKKKIRRDLSTLSEQELVDFHRAFVGMIFQAFYLIPGLSAKQNILLPAILEGSLPQDRDKKANDLMKRFGIIDFQDRNPSRLSGGQQQRVAIARSLVNNPSLVLADEPVGNLDSENAAIVVDMISDLNRTDNKTVIHVTHDPRHLSLADRVFYLKDGQIDRVVINQKTKKPSQYRGVAHKDSLVDKITMMYPYATKDQIKAKLIINKILLPYSYHEIERIEKIVTSYLSNSIDYRRMEKLFDAPEHEGGVNLYKQTAKKIAGEVASLSEEIKIIEKEEKNNIPLSARARQILHFLSEEYDLALEGLQEIRAIEAIAYRLSGNITTDEFQKILDESLKEGGAGLHKHVADKISQEVELLIINI